MKAVKTRLLNAEETKKKLRELGVLINGVSAKREGSFVYFPVSKNIPGFTVVNKVFSKPVRIDFQKELSKILSKKELSEFISSFDTVGDIALIEIPSSLDGKKKKIAELLLKTNKSLRTILRKKSAFLGEYRVKELEFLAGERKTTALYKEAGAVMNVDLSNSYFSSRLAFERLRIAKQLKPGEKILALFAGVGPFPLVFFKQQKKLDIVAIELNPNAVKQLKENVALNKAEKSITVIEGDVNEVLKDYKNWADRVVMPLPHTSKLFLDSVLRAAAKNCIIHYYAFNSFNKNLAPFDEVLSDIKQACARNNKKCKILNKRIARPYSASLVQVVIDFSVL
ncbi:class I SAM-dependent methyltransferase family protein [Candidatus Micrarchaeota archaeon]|nr:class I SAM-dependent methyltransferase family protein [Candidatus Micrarchaeota archaeon]